MASKDRTQLSKGDIVRFPDGTRARLQSKPRPDSDRPDSAWTVLIRDLNDAGKETGATNTFILLKDTRLNVVG